MKKLHNPVGHLWSRSLCRENANHLDVIPDVSISYKYELVKVGNYLKYMIFGIFSDFRACGNHKNNSMRLLISIS